MAVIDPIGHDTVTLLLLQLGVLLLVARILGHVATRFGWPSVIGELTAGVLLGPSILGAFAPGVFAVFVPADAGQFHILEAFAFFGVLLLLVITGLETDIDLIARKGRTAAAISICGIVVPFAIGFGLGQVLPGAFIADTDQRLVFSLFLGTAMGISAIPVIAKVLIEMNAVKRDIGQLTLAAGMIDDTLGWIILSVVAGLARSGVVDVPSVVQSVLSVLVIVGLAFTAGRRAMAWLFRKVDERSPGDLAKVTLLMVLALLFGSLTHYLGIEAVLGAFLVGILVGQVKRFTRTARHMFETFTLGVFAPIFFAASGLRVDLRALLDPTVLGVGLIVLAAAIVGKFAGAALGAKLSGLGKWEALSLGAGMNARGAIEIIIATVGLSLGILTTEMYTIILLVAIVTSLMAPPILRVTLRHVPWTDAERERLDSERRRSASFLAGVNRVLMPTRGGGNSFLAARLLGLALGEEKDIEVKLMSVVGQEVTTGAVADARANVQRESEHADAALASVASHLVRVPKANVRHLVQHVHGNVVDTILAEADRGYDLLVVGASNTNDVHDGHPLFGSLTDRIVQGAQCPIFVVSDNAGMDSSSLDQWLPRSILLPTAGTGAGAHAVELSCAIAQSAEATIEILHVVEDEPAVERWSSAASSRRRQEIGEELLESTEERVRAAGVRARTHLAHSERIESGILDTAEKLQVDLVVLSSSVRPVTSRAFFGHRIDHVLRQATSPVLVIS